ncbi:MAG: FAD-binding protein, partial [Terracoccus sp.]
MTTTVKSETMPTPARRVPYDELAAVTRGSVVLPGDAADVVAGVRFAKAHGIVLAVRGGGHNAAGLGVWDDALVLDLSPMHSVTADPQSHTVRVDGGCTWG